MPLKKQKHHITIDSKNSKLNSQVVWFNNQSQHFYSIKVTCHTWVQLTCLV